MLVCVCVVFVCLFLLVLLSGCSGTVVDQSCVFLFLILTGCSGRLEADQSCVCFLFLLLSQSVDVLVDFRLTNLVFCCCFCYSVDVLVDFSLTNLVFFCLLFL